jgi:Protein of unknown function (DUF998)
MKTKGLVVLFAGITAVIVYIAFTLVAFLQYPDAYGPLTNWLSDLGNPQASPSGALFYNLGCILTSVVLFIFFTSIGKWNNGNKKMRMLLTIAQIMGIFSACSLILAALFPLGPHTSTHSFWSSMLTVGIGFFLTFSATAFLRHPAFMRWIAYYAFLAALVNFIYALSEAIGYKFFIGEWVAIGMFIVYLFLIANNSRVLVGDYGRIQN